MNVRFDLRSCTANHYGGGGGAVKLKRVEKTLRF